MINLVLLGVVVAAMVLLVLFGEGQSILGLEPSMFAALVSAGVMIFLVMGGRGAHAAGSWRETARNAALWGLILLGVTVSYAYRFEVQDVANRVLAEIAPGHVVMARGGEVTVVRSGSGMFLMQGQVNGRPARFMFDTGASSVVLTEASARAAGLDPAKLDYTVTISTANGRTTAARVRLDRLEIGPIVETRVEALVSRPGSLSENLLGMSFLERLASYEVRDDKLVLRGNR